MVCSAVFLLCGGVCFLLLLQPCGYLPKKVQRHYGMQSPNWPQPLSIAFPPRPRQTSDDRAIVEPPINLLDEFKFHMSIKWMLPWWLADPTNCRCLPLLLPPLPISFGLPPLLLWLSCHFPHGGAENGALCRRAPCPMSKMVPQPLPPATLPSARLQEPPSSAPRCKVMLLCVC